MTPTEREEAELRAIADACVVARAITRGLSWWDYTEALDDLLVSNLALAEKRYA